MAERGSSEWERRVEKTNEKAGDALEEMPLGTDGARRTKRCDGRRKALRRYTQMN